MSDQAQALRDLVEREGKADAPHTPTHPETFEDYQTKFAFARVREEMKRGDRS